MTARQADFIWYDAGGRGYNRYALFRRSFRLEGEPEGGTLHIFADTRYRLLVNGVVLGHGPARFFTPKPEYDSVDISPFLQQGTNTIAVMVNSYGCVTFHSEGSTGGLVAWGHAADRAGNRVDLATPAGWQAVECPAHQNEAAKLSFALNPGETFHAARLEPDWAAPEFDDSAWPDAVPVADQEHWGELRPRSIALLDERQVWPAGRIATHAARFAEDEDLYSFAIIAEETRFRQRGLPAMAFTYLHSVVDQEVTIGAFWGRYWLNGEELQPIRRDDISLRQDFHVRLREGWNSFVVLERLYYSAWEFYLGLPRSAAVAVSAERGLHSPNIFLLAGPFEGDAARAAEALTEPPHEPDDLPAELGPWRPWARGRSACSAYAERAWKTFSPLPNVHAVQVMGADYAEDVGDGTLALLYDFGGEVLGRPMLDFTAAEGTLVDLSYSEKLGPDGLPADQTPHHVRMAERCVAREGRQEWQTFHPRGMRYLEVLVTGDLNEFELHGLALTRANYPVRNIGSLECSDPMLNRMWEVGRATQHACMEDAYLDCPRRERGLYAGDMLVQFYTDLAAYGDTRLFRRCLELFLLSQDNPLPPGDPHADGLVAAGAHGIQPGRHPDYSAITVQALYHYYARTGDADFLIRMKPRIDRLMAGLASLEVEGLGLLDGSDLGPYIDRQRMDRGGINCALNCFYQRAFADAARIMVVVGDSDAWERHKAMADRLAAAIREQFWDMGRRAFTDRRPVDVPDTAPSVASNALPLLYDIAAEDQVAGALDYLTDALLSNFRVPEPVKDDDLNCMPYFAYYAAGALCKHGRVEEALQFFRDCWGWMLEKGVWTWWETFNGGSACHAWSSCPRTTSPAACWGSPSRSPATRTWCASSRTRPGCSGRPASTRCRPGR